MSDPQADPVVSLSSTPTSRMEWWLRFTPRSVLVGWKWRKWGSEKRFRLEELQPEFGDPTVSRDFLSAAFSILSAVFVWLALKNPGQHEVMLWSFAGICWVGLVLHMQRKKTHLKTLIKKTDGTYAFVLDHKDFDPTELEGFLAELKQRIEAERDGDSTPT